MKYEIKMMGGDIFEISEETAMSLTNKTGLVGIKELNGIINMSSVVSVMAQGVAKTKESKNIVKCHDGSFAILKNGSWIDEYSGSKLDLSYYPELLKEHNNLLTLNQ